MFVCPICNKEIESESRMAKHFLECWKSEHPYHKSKEAPQSPDTETREISDDIMDFFNNGRSKS